MKVKAPQPPATDRLRVWALSVAELAPRLLLPLNPPVLVSSRREAAEAALMLPVAPEHYSEDLRVCLGLTLAEDEAVKTAALRLGQELLAFCASTNPMSTPCRTSSNAWSAVRWSGNLPPDALASRPC